MPDDRSVTAVLSRAQGHDTGWTFIYAPGAGSNIDDPFGVYAASRLAQHGISTARFQFPYMEEKRRAPDRTPVLEATWLAATEAFHGLDDRLVAGGRSMGGRIASLVAAQGSPAGRTGALCLSSARTGKRRMGGTSTSPTYLSPRCSVRARATPLQRPRSLQKPSPRSRKPAYTSWTARTTVSRSESPAARRARTSGMRLSRSSLTGCKR